MKILTTIKLINVPPVIYKLIRVIKTRNPLKHMYSKLLETLNIILWQEARNVSLVV